MDEVIVRLCTREDLPSVVDLMKELREVAHGEQVSLNDVNKVFEIMETLPEIYLNMVAEISGRVVGFISVIFYKTVFHKGGTALINELIITESERGKGIGELLVQRAENEARRRGLDEIEVGTEKTNEAAQKFYRKCGFDEEYVLMGKEFES